MARPVFARDRWSISDLKKHTAYNDKPFFHSPHLTSLTLMSRDHKFNQTVWQISKLIKITFFLGFFFPNRSKRFIDQIITDRLLTQKKPPRSPSQVFGRLLSTIFE